MTKKILLISDMVGYGKVALSAAMPILIHKGYELFNMPTVLISNTLNYGKSAMLDTTAYMKDTVKVWDELGFKLDAMSVGFIASVEQAKWLAGYCKEQHDKGTKVFLDPIMGDNGKLYNSVTEEKISCVKEIMVSADYVVPNYTEACYLTGAEYSEDGATFDELKEILLGLHKLGAGSAIITSAPVKSAVDPSRVEKQVVGYDGVNDKFFGIGFEELPVKFNGTGDTFLAILISHVMEGKSLRDSAILAVKGVSNLIMRNVEYAGEYNGIPIETSLDVL